MSTLAILPNISVARWAAAWQAFAARHAAHAATQHTSDTAAALYERAAHYEATQPGFAADLRAAAEGLDRAGVRQRR
jgi:hypothetical protein